MDFLRQQIVIIQERLRGLTPSQKLLAGSLVVIMMMTMLYWGRFAATGDYVALSTVPATAAEQAAVADALGRSAIAHTNEGGVIRVPADRLGDARNAITTAVATQPAGSGSVLLAMLDKLSPLATQGEFSARMQGVFDQSIEGMIKTWPGVQTATIHVNESVRGSLLPTPAGVTVNITTAGNGIPKNLARAAQAAVMPLVKNLKPDGVTVMVDGVAVIKSGTGADGGGFAASDLMENQSNFERQFVQAIKDYYHIDGLQVFVSADVSAETRHDKIVTPDLKNKVSLVKDSTSEKTITTDAAPVAEPGAVPNMSLDASGGAMAGRGGSKTERSEESFENKFGITESEVSTPAGKIKITGATVRVPRPWFLKSCKAANKGVDPSDDVLATYMSTKLAEMRKEIAATTKITDPESLIVVCRDDYEAPSDMMLASSVVAAAAPGSISLVTAHGKELAIGGLALTSLFMVGRMVKKSTPAMAEAPLVALDGMPDVSSGPKKLRKPLSMGSIDIAGEVAEGGPIMMGQELDEEVLETSQMVEQVSGFVKDNPDTTAQLLKRWMTHE